MEYHLCYSSMCDFLWWRNNSGEKWALIRWSKKYKDFYGRFCEGESHLGWIMDMSFIILFRKWRSRMTCVIVRIKITICFVTDVVVSLCFENVKLSLRMLEGLIIWGSEGIFLACELIHLRQYPAAMAPNIVAESKTQIQIQSFFMVWKKFLLTHVSGFLKVDFLVEFSAT